MDLLSAFPPLMSACNRPSYTNYVGGFHGCLDYIFIQPESMQVRNAGDILAYILKAKYKVIVCLTSDDGCRWSR